MEHIIVTELENNKVKLVPEEGYVLVHIPTGTEYAEAIIAKTKMKYFKAKAIEE